MSKEMMYILIFLLSVFISSVSQIILKISANKTYPNKWQEYVNFRVVSAYAIFFAASFLSVVAYRSVPLSIAPVLESTGYIYVTVLGFFWLKEKLSRKKLAGMAVIIIGILIFNYK